LKIIDVCLSRKSYKIKIKKGLIKEIAKEIQNIYDGNRLIIISDENVMSYYGKMIIDNLLLGGFHYEVIILKPGEKTKSFEEYGNICNTLLNMNVSRGDLIIAFGGGVVGDIAGFVASTYMRGIPYIQIPTTILSQVDSSIGGKVAINMQQGKNVLGNFYHPELVLIDPELLRTLDERFISDGMAEVIKYGCIKDKSLFNLLNLKVDFNDLYEIVEEIIYLCCDIKRKFVEEDELDKGNRMMLNFGHTIGHAIEKYYDYDYYSHGEAVAIGMYNIVKNTEYLGLTKLGTSDTILEILKKYNLPYEMPDIANKQLIDIVKKDKKRNADIIHLVILKEIGQGNILKVHTNELERYL